MYAPASCSAMACIHVHRSAGLTAFKVNGARRRPEHEADDEGGVAEEKDGKEKCDSSRSATSSNFGCVSSEVNAADDPWRTEEEEQAKHLEPERCVPHSGNEVADVGDDTIEHGDEVAVNRCARWRAVLRL